MYIVHHFCLLSMIQSPYTVQLDTVHQVAYYSHDTSKWHIRKISAAEKSTLNIDLMSMTATVNTLESKETMTMMKYYLLPAHESMDKTQWYLLYLFVSF